MLLIEYKIKTCVCVITFIKKRSFEGGIGGNGGKIG